MTAEKTALLGLSRGEIASLLPSAPTYTAKQVRAFCFEGKSIGEMTSLSKALRAEMSEKFVSNPVTILKVYPSRDGSKKYLSVFPTATSSKGCLCRTTTATRFACPRR